MLWTPTQQFHPRPFDKEAKLEAVIAEVKAALFGKSRNYLDVKKLIGERGERPDHGGDWGTADTIFHK